VVRDKTARQKMGSLTISLPVIASYEIFLLWLRKRLLLLGVTSKEQLEEY
jgi:hypothetical protein